MIEMAIFFISQLIITIIIIIYKIPKNMYEFYAYLYMIFLSQPVDSHRCRLCQHVENYF